MAIHILYDMNTGCCFYDSSTMVAFGPVFQDDERALAFDAWCRQKGIKDLRMEVQRLIQLKDEFDQLVEQRNLRDSFTDMIHPSYDWKNYKRPDDTLASVVSRIPWKTAKQIDKS